MAGDIRANIGLSIRSDPTGDGNINYQSRPATFGADIITPEAKGPTPGDITVAVAGTDVLFEELGAAGGMCFIRNRDSVNYVTYGTWNGAVFLPLGELLPGEHAVIRLARPLQAGGPYTGTGANPNLRIYASAAPCRVTVDAFDP